MKFNLNKLVVALALTAAAGQASAAVVPASTGDGDLFLTTWDPVASVSYSRDLGVSLSSFLSSATPAAGLTNTFAGDALFQSAFANSTASNISWNIVAGDNVLSSGQFNYTTDALRILTTSTVAPGTGFIFKNSSLTGATNNINNFQGYQVNDPVPLGTGCGTNPSCVITNPTDPGFGGNTTWGSNFGGNGTPSNVGTGFGSSLYFYYLTGSGTSGTIGPGSNAIQTAFANATGDGMWSLSSNGTATYAIPGVSAVPVPAAAWLFGSGLLGLVGIARRKRPV
ncbi:MAG: VPLPA-CTERM sorting domain-containing protein [Sulfuricaulis sp.]